MKVKVVPERPIPGILPKNKWIDVPMELDLNKNEIIRCMNYGTVYKDGNPVDKISTIFPNKNNSYIASDLLQQLFDHPTEKAVIDHVIDTKVIDDDKSESIEIMNIMQSLDLVSFQKDNEYIILECQFNTNSIQGGLNGKLYGLFNITSGNRPSVLEYKNNDQWVKFNSKFTDLSSIKDGHKFIFRFIPKDESTIEFKILIKEGNKLLVKLEDKLDPNKK